jgi:hypothetical protein
MKRNTIALISNQQHLRPESRANELSTHAPSAIFVILGALLLGYFLEHLRDGGSVLGVEVRVDFVEEVEGCGVALLDCEDECEGA